MKLDIGIHLRTISHWILFCIMSWRITLLKLLPHLPGANEFIVISSAFSGPGYCKHSTKWSLLSSQVACSICQKLRPVHVRSSWINNSNATTGGWFLSMAKPGLGQWEMALYMQCILSLAEQVPANEGRHHICTVSSHWLRPCSALERKWAGNTGEYSNIPSISLILTVPADGLELHVLWHL